MDEKSILVQHLSGLEEIERFENQKIYFRHGTAPTQLSNRHLEGLPNYFMPVFTLTAVENRPDLEHGAFLICEIQEIFCFEEGDIIPEGFINDMGGLLDDIHPPYTFYKLSEPINLPYTIPHQNLHQGQLGDDFFFGGQIPPNYLVSWNKLSTRLNEISNNL